MLLNIDILEEFVKDYHVSLTGSDIARKKNLNQKTVSTYLKTLEEDNILKSRTLGKNKLYSLNLDDNIIISRFLSMIEASRTIKFLKKNPLIKEAVSDIKADIIIIFGSYAKNTNKKDSDLDIAIIGDLDKDSVRQAEKTYRIEINAKVFRKEEFNKKDLLANEIIKDHIIIKGAEEYISHTLSND